MITYGFSVIGKSHIKKNVVCQDSNKIGKLACGLYMGIVADGVGSAPSSDIGSKLAVNSLFEYCNKKIKKDMNSSNVENVLVQGYSYAFNQIEKYTKEHKGKIEDYDTTLSCAVYDGENIVYGHAGDGGIIVRYQTGKTESVTERQKGVDGISVRPLRAGKTSWKFGKKEGKKICSVLLVTDGMLDGVIQPILINLPSDRISLAKGNFKNDNVYITATEFFMNPYAIYLNKNIKNPDKYIKKFIGGNLSKEEQKDYLNILFYAYTKYFGKHKAGELCASIQNYCYGVWAMKNVEDDKSIVCMMNETINVKPIDDKLYIEPNWSYLQKCYEALLYGGNLPDNPCDKENIFEENMDNSDEKFQKNNININNKKYKKKTSRKYLPAILVGAVFGIALLIGINSALGLNAQKKQRENLIVNNKEKNTAREKYTRKELQEKAEEFLNGLLTIEDISSLDKEKFVAKVEKTEMNECIKMMREKHLNETTNNMIKEQNDTKSSYESEEKSEYIPKEEFDRKSIIEEFENGYSEKNIKEFGHKGSVTQLNEIMELVYTKDQQREFTNIIKNQFEKKKDGEKQIIKANLNKLYSVDESQSYSEIKKGLEETSENYNETTKKVEETNSDYFGEL